MAARLIDQQLADPIEHVPGEPPAFQDRPALEPPPVTIRNGSPPVW